MPRSLPEPQPVLAVTSRLTGSSAETLRQSVDALREVAGRLGLEVAGPPLRVVHEDESVLEICLPIADLPAEEPPPPRAAEVLIPGTVVESLDGV